MPESPYVHKKTYIDRLPELSLTTSALTTQRVLCKNCRFNNQPIIWWVSCPKLAQKDIQETSLSTLHLAVKNCSEEQEQKKQQPDKIISMANTKNLTTYTPTVEPKLNTTQIIYENKDSVSMATSSPPLPLTPTPPPPPPPHFQHRVYHHRSIPTLSTINPCDYCGYESPPRVGESHIHNYHGQSNINCKRCYNQQKQEHEFQYGKHNSQHRQYYPHQQSPLKFYPQTHQHTQYQHYQHNHHVQQQEKQQHHNSSCNFYNMECNLDLPACACVCGKFHHPYQPSLTSNPNIMAMSNTPSTSRHNSRVHNYPFYYDPEHWIHQAEQEQESGFPGLRDQEFHLLHRNIPALRRTGIDTTGIRQYFYPDGGWGWIICGISVLVHILTTGLQFSHSLILFYTIQHINNANGKEWLGALSWSISMLLSPFVDILCKRKYTRLLAVIGGLVMTLGILFTSFAIEIDQIIFSYGFVFSIGVAMVRETSSIMIGNYFKKRRHFIEMVSMSGEGMGIVFFSILLREGVGKVGWRCGLQIIAGLCSVSFFMGLLYRPASLYHPQRRAIQHLKNQHKKFHDHKSSNKHSQRNIFRKLYEDISNLKSDTIRILLITTAVAALGIYTPIFTMSLSPIKTGSTNQELVLLQTILGMSITLGVVVAGVFIRPFVIRSFTLSTSIVAQIFLTLIALSILFMSFVINYESLYILYGLYGVGFGGFRFSLKILALERIKMNFSKIWSLSHAMESTPVLISVPLTIFLNNYSLKYGRAGYYICSAAAAIAAIIIFFINHSKHSVEKQSSQNLQSKQQKLQSDTQGILKQYSIENGMAPRGRSMSIQYMRSKYPNISMIDHCSKNNNCSERDLINRSCVSLNQMPNTDICSCSLMKDCHCQFHHSSINDHFLHHCPYSMTSNAKHLPLMSDRHNINVCHYDIGKNHSYLRRSLSYLPNINYCDTIHCHCPNNNIKWSHQDLRPETGNPYLYRNVPYSINYYKSQSVPEDLSTITKQCKCQVQRSINNREIIYVPKDRSKNLPENCVHCSLQHSCLSVISKEMTGTHDQTSTIPNVSTFPRLKPKRSQSLTKCDNQQQVEERTTSV